MPNRLKEFVHEQIAKGRYGTKSEYVCELIREDEKRKAEKHLEQMLLEGLRGEATDVTHSDWAAIRKDVLGQVNVRKLSR